MFGVLGIPLLENKKVSGFPGYRDSLLLVSRIIGFLVSWFLGYLVIVLVSLVAWLGVSWFLGSLVYWFQSF